MLQAALFPRLLFSEISRLSEQLEVNFQCCELLSSFHSFYMRSRDLLKSLVHSLLLVTKINRLAEQLEADILTERTAAVQPLLLVTQINRLAEQLEADILTERTAAVQHL